MNLTFKENRMRIINNEPLKFFSHHSSPLLLHSCLVFQSTYIIVNLRSVSLWWLSLHFGLLYLGGMISLLYGVEPVWKAQNNLLTKSLTLLLHTSLWFAFLMCPVMFTLPFWKQHLCIWLGNKRYNYSDICRHYEKPGSMTIPTLTVSLCDLTSHSISVLYSVWVGGNIRLLSMCTRLQESDKWLDPESWKRQVSESSVPHESGTAK